MMVLNVLDNLRAGIRRHMTEPDFPATLAGTVCGSAMCEPQYPLLTGTMDSFAMMIAPRIAVATSLAHLTPRPT